MKKSRYLIYAVALMFAMLSSCSNDCKESSGASDTQTPNSNTSEKSIAKKDVDEESEGELLTKKILYDVPVVNLRLTDRTQNDPNWFWENLPSPDGDEFIKKMYEDARDCKIPIYYYDMQGDYEHLERIPDKKVKDMFKNEMTVSILDENIKLDYTRIIKLKFLEEWRIVDGEIVKKVLAYAPVFMVNIAASEDQEAQSYNYVMFWVMADEKLLN